VRASGNGFARSIRVTMSRLCPMICNMTYPPFRSYSLNTLEIAAYASQESF
jgi:hypothetical protein